MKAEETKTAAAVMIAHAEGRKVQEYDSILEKWDACDFPTWNWQHNVYRIAPDLIEVEVWVHDDGRIVNRGYMGPMQAEHAGFVPRRATIHPETK